MELEINLGIFQVSAMWHNILSENYFILKKCVNIDFFITFNNSYLFWESLTRNITQAENWYIHWKKN